MVKGPHSFMLIQHAFTTGVIAVLKMYFFDKLQDIPITHCHQHTIVKATREKRDSEIPLSADQIASVKAFYEEMGKNRPQKNN